MSEPIVATTAGQVRGVSLDGVVRKVAVAEKVTTKVAQILKIAPDLASFRSASEEACIKALEAASEPARGDNRPRLLLVLAAVWTVGNLTTAYAGGFVMLFLARMLAGLGAVCASPWPSCWPPTIRRHRTGADRCWSFP